jgi:Domain of unknown function (DUF6268)
MQKKYIFSVFAYLLAAACAVGQATDSIPEEEEEDFSAYAEMNTADGSKTKTYCTQKVFGQSPTRLISVGYEFQAPYEMGLNQNTNGVAAETENVNFSHGLRLETSIPVISRNDVIWNVGGSYTDQYYSFNDAESEMTQPLSRSLNQRALRNLSLNTLVFKPFNSKTFLLAQVLGDYAGDWNFAQWQPITATKLSGTVIYGRKKSDRMMWGLGATRTYRAGEVNYLPVFLMNYSSVSQKWGVEMLLPARADVRYSISARNILKMGLELEGASYRLNDKNNHFRNANQVGTLEKLELKRSEIKLRLSWDFQLKNFYWANLTAGYRIMYRYNIDEGAEVFRGFGLVNDQAYFNTNEVGSALFINFSVNFVSP